MEYEVLTEDYGQGAGFIALPVSRHTGEKMPDIGKPYTAYEVLTEFFGISNHSIPSPHEQTVLKQYRKLSRVSRNTVDAMTRTMLQQEVDARNDILRDAYFILPLLLSSETNSMI